MPIDYNSTLNLPKTDFAMKAGLPQSEPVMLKKWYDEDMYGKLMKANSDKPLFVLHDGPPYANGDIHIGHALNKILKDIIIRYKNISGFKAPYIPGWDTHGLPIENQTIKKLGSELKNADILEYRRICHEFAENYINIQREQFKRLGGIGDWDNPYITLTPEFEAHQIEVFGQIALKGYIYKGMKPVYWCPSDETALAEAEIEYEESPCESIYVKFKVLDGKGKFDDINDVYFVIWTTTPWTLPGNMAITLNPDFEYAMINVDSEHYIVASELIESFVKETNIESYKKIKTVKGAELEYITTQHPFLDRESLIILGDHVTLEAGTGCVHTAPGHGVDDFIVCSNYEIPVVVPVDGRGILTDEAGKFAGMFYEKANKAILEELSQTNHLLAVKRIMHQYPHCWRCKKPIIFRATEQWFCSVKDFKEAVMEEVKNIKWIPDWGMSRMLSMVDRADWCISRQRKWGVPIPIFYCEKCYTPLITEKTIKIVSDLFKHEGSDSWFKYSAEEILGAEAKCAECGNTAFRKENDIMDVWFDSGTSHAGVCDVRPELSWPCDLYLEGNDQFRGWFQSSILTAVAWRGKAPYKTVLTHGFTTTAEGKKMSKSLGNAVDPNDIIKEFGADILRLWVASTDYTTDIRISKDMIKQLSEVYRKLRNTARFLLGNLGGGNSAPQFNPNDKNNTVEFKDMLELDRWAVIKLNELLEKIYSAYEAYEFHIIFHALHNFCVVDMSNFYLDVIKDRLYVEKSDSFERRSAQSAMYLILDALVRLMSPILSFTAEEIWSHMPHKDGDDETGVMFNDIIKYNPLYKDDELLARWEVLLDLRAKVQKCLETARADKLIGSSLEAKVKVLLPNDENSKIIMEYKDFLPTLFICSQTQAEILGESLQITVEKADGEKCERCWIYSADVGSNKEHPTICPRCATVCS